MARKPRPIAQPAEYLTPLFDAHTHLASTGAKTAEEVKELLDKAEAAGVVGVCTVGDGLAEAELAAEHATMDPRVWAAVAIHPTRAKELVYSDDVKARLAELAAQPRVVAVGETGLDWYWLEDMDNCANREEQEESLRWHAKLAQSVNKPLMIHNREADTDLLRVLADIEPVTTVILHCFSSPLAVAEEAIERGYVLSFAGNVTFKRNDELRAAAKLCPQDQILVETDAPYMTPEPFRGSRNSSGIIGHTARLLADVRGDAPEELAATVTANARRIYDIS
ncbi:TatD family hydrolase [Corynebacterium ulceribovis]|uniref:TatD family hydrolase n=1 Tax=Corynebacterium ulceribovis TaxID=487732 RepID=UPI00036D3FC0|nr:TatD family hydrolase [Corynebacterium ulceribovis]